MSAQPKPAVRKPVNPETIRSLRRTHGWSERDISKTLGIALPAVLAALRSAS
jgi:hypothetical protein